jgi:hypothetical protein
MMVSIMRIRIIFSMSMMCWGLIKVISISLMDVDIDILFSISLDKGLLHKWSNVRI